MAVELVVKCDDCGVYLNVGDESFCANCYDSINGECEKLADENDELKKENLELTQENELLKDQLQQLRVSEV